jgi:ribose transport system permease protein
MNSSEVVATTGNARAWLRSLAATSDFSAAFPVLLLSGMVIAYLRLQPAAFTTNTLTGVLTDALPLILVGAGQTIVIVNGGIDISVGGIISLISALGATRLSGGTAGLIGWSVILVLLGLALGACNGLLIGGLGLSPVIVTIATWSIWGGVALFILKEPGGNVSLSYLDFWTGQTFGVPNAVYLVIVICVVWLIFRRTPVATYLYAVGSDPEAARLTGIGVFRLRLLAYALSGGLSGLAALALVGTQASGDPNIGNPFVLTSIAVVVIGGTAITGGRGGVIRTAVGACIYVMIGYLLFAANVESSFITLCTGLALLFAVAVSTLGGALAARISRA